MDVAQMLGLVSVVDACREATHVVLENKFDSSEDLGKLIEAVETKFSPGENISILSAAKIINQSVSPARKVG